MLEEAMSRTENRLNQSGIFSQFFLFNIFPSGVIKPHFSQNKKTGENAPIVRQMLGITKEVA